MAYLTIKQVKQQYSIADKTIRRLYEGKTISRSQAYKNKKGRWLFNSDFIQAQYPDKLKDQAPEQVKDTPEPSQTDNSQTDSSNSALIRTIEILQQQLAVKDTQLERYDQKLDQQQKLTAQLQTQLLITSSPEPIKADISKTPPKATPKPKKPVKQPVKTPSSIKKTPKPKRWWRKG